MSAYIQVKTSGKLSGESELIGAKNAVLVIMTSLLLTRGKSVYDKVKEMRDI